MNPTIDSIEIRHYRLLLETPFNASWDPKPRTEHVVTVVRICASDFEGVGAGDSMAGLAANVSLFLGHDPFNIERHVRILDNLQFHYGRMWPVEVALWDLMGQISGQPLWKLLGGLRHRVKPYASTGERVAPEVRAESAKTLRGMGFEAIKLRFHAENPRDDLQTVQAVREAIGYGPKIMVDANQGWQMPWDSRQPWDYKTACWMADALAELDVFWLEEPLHRHNYRELARLRQRTNVRIAGGEGNREFSELQEYLAHGSLDVYQPDVVWSTGVLRARQLAHQVQAAGAIYSPHTWGDGLVLLANLHVTAAVSDTPYLEYPFDPPHWLPGQRDFMLPAPLLPDGDGYLTLTDAPGLGVAIDWPGLERLRLYL